MSKEKVDETVIRVRYAEVDSMGVVHHSHYIVWFEAGRSSFLRRVDRSYAEVERAGYFFRIAETGARYLAPAFYDEEVTVRTWLSELHSRELAFSYAVVRTNDPGNDGHERILVTGFSKLICTDRQGRVRRIPEAMRATLDNWLVKEPVEAA